MSQDDHRPHRPADEPSDDKEEIYYEGSPELRWQLASGWPWALIGIVIILAPIFIKLVSSSSTSIPWWAYPAALFLGACFIIVPWYKSKTKRYKITNYRINFETGFISRTIDTLEMWHIEDLKFHQSILDRLMGVGTITVISHDDTTPKLVINGIPNPRQLFDILQQRVIAVKRQRGVVKMDIPSTPPIS